MFAAAGTLDVAFFSFDTVDAARCGDTFMGTMLAGRASGYTLVDAAQLASCVSTYVACGHGAQASYGSAPQTERALLAFKSAA